MVAYSLPLIPNKISWTIINLSDRLVIINTIGSSAAGLYAVAYKFPTLMDTVYGFFYQAGSFTLSAAGCIPLNGAGAAIRNIEQTGGVIVLPEAGVYDVSYALTLPAGTTATGSLSLLRGGSAVPGTTVAFAKTTAGAPVTVSSRSIITAAAGATLCIASNAALALTAAEDETLAALVIRRIG